MPRLRRDRWIADVYSEGKRIRKTFQSRELAEAFEANPDAGLHTMGGLLDVVNDLRWRGSKNEANATRPRPTSISNCSRTAPSTRPPGAASGSSSSSETAASRFQGRGGSSRLGP